LWRVCASVGEYQDIQAKQQDLSDAIHSQQKTEASFRAAGQRSEEVHNRTEAELRAKVERLEQAVTEARLNAEKAHAQRQVFETKWTTVRTDLVRCFL